MPRSYTLALLPLVLCAACKDRRGDTGFVWPEATAEAVRDYTALVESTYIDALALAVALDEAIDVLVTTPSADTLTAARQAWLDSREPYLQTEVYRFYDGPIDNPEDGPEGLINAWPLDEHTIDYVLGDPDAGIIQDLTLEITQSKLVELNGVGGEANVTTGYHAIEFLLWGQDLSADGPGDRPYTDYVPGTGTNVDRRAIYLDAVGALLVLHLDQVRQAWQPGADYPQGLEDDPEAAFEKMLTGMIVLSGFETGGERLQASLDSGSQEDEHSCFSDNTHRDMIQDVQGILNVWEGRYTRLNGEVFEGTGVGEIVSAVDPDLAAQMDARIRESLALAQALQPPYDQEIASGNAEGRARVQALVVSLRAQEELLFQVFTAFGLSVEVPE